MRRRISAFTLIETLCTVVIIGVLISLFYGTLGSSWGAMDHYSTRANLSQDMNQIIDQVTLQAREAQSMTVPSGGASVSFFDRTGTVISSCAFDPQGILTMTKTGISSAVITRRVDPALSSFKIQPGGRSLLVTLVLADNVSGRRVQVDASTEIFPRN